jgi:hypothetical protein
MLALARALLGLIRPLHRCVPVPRSAFAVRAHHTRTAGVPPASAFRGSGPVSLWCPILLALTWSGQTGQAPLPGATDDRKLDV